MIQRDNVRWTDSCGFLAFRCLLLTCHVSVPCPTVLRRRVSLIYGRSYPLYLTEISYSKQGLRVSDLQVRTQRSYVSVALFRSFISVLYVFRLLPQFIIFILLSCCDFPFLSFLFHYPVFCSSSSCYFYFFPFLTLNLLSYISVFVIIYVIHVFLFTSFLYMAELWRDFWICETGTSQQVAQLHDRYMMTMMIFPLSLISYP
jgi:hypothetical protein